MSSSTMWKKKCSVCVVEPVDDFSRWKYSVASQTTDEMLHLNFDISEFIRGDLPPKPGNRRLLFMRPTASEPFLFAAPALKRMSAEQPSR